MCFYMVKLSKLQINKPSVIHSINTDSITLSRVISMGIKPNSVITVLRRGYGNILHCRVNTTEFALGNKLCESIVVNIL